MTSIPKEALIRGGKSQRPDQRTFSRDRALAAEAGRKGGKSKRKKLKAEENGQK